MNENLFSILKEYGLDEKEIKLYSILVKNVKLTGYKIAKESGFHRSTTYYILDKLIEKGFVSRQYIAKTYYYCSNDLSAVISGLKNKEDLLISLVSEIRKMQKEENLNVRIFEGDSGAKEFNFNLLQLISEKRIKEVIMIGNGPPEDFYFNTFIGKIIKEIKKAKTYKQGTFRAIWSLKLRGNKFIKQYEIFGENRFLDNIPSDTTTIIYGDYLSFSLTSDKHYVIEIKNISVANEMKAYFNHLWKIAKK
ncbi:MAG: helix-turn-helix domain-containing protein [Nanoarchaeota archaeon]|nr:helix-turn-helix domain-containing protein [Nanoarchaeota archaeon]